MEAFLLVSVIISELMSNNGTVALLAACRPFGAASIPFMSEITQGC